MASVNSIRIPGLASGIDTETMIKEMLTGDQNKIDKAKQKEQTVKWQQEIYREVIGEIKGFQEKFLSMTSANSIINSKAWNSLSINSSNSSVITATGSAGANNVDYKFDVRKLATSAKISYKVDSKNAKLSDLHEDFKDPNFEKAFKIETGDNKESKTITLTGEDTVESLMKKINDSMSGEIKASYSEMTGEFTIETKKTGANSTLKFVDIKTDVDGNEVEGDILSQTSGSNSEIIVSSKDGSFSKTLNEESNTFTIDGVTYNVHSEGSSEITSKEDVQPILDNMKSFVEEYNKIMDKIYDLVTEKKNADYPPLTEAQREDMSEEEIERWEKKAKNGILRNDSEMRAFMNNMKEAIFGDNMATLQEMGLSSHSDYNKRGQLSLDVDKFTKALQENGEKVYNVFAKDSNSMIENMKKTMDKYVGNSASIFAKKAGLDKTASAVNNLYSNQLKKQEEFIKNLQTKMAEREEALYKKFAQLESNMNKFNSQMNYLSQ